MSLSTRPRPTQRNFSILIAAGGVLAVFAFLYFGIQATYDPGEIISGSNTVLNPDGGAYMSNLPSDAMWTATNDEFTQFETVAGIGGANQPWRVLENAGNEPTGVADPNDTQSGGSCGNTDIVTDQDGGYDYAYYSVIDPDGTADNGDEILAFAIRISDKVSGAFTFSILVDAQNDITSGSDANVVCGNPGFEYEIQISTQGNKINLYNIDGCAGQANCDGLNGGDATICEPCNTGALQVRAASSACASSGLDPVFWMGHIPFSQLSGVNSTDDFRLVVATTTSPNEVIYKGTNVADYGGIGDPGASSECDCVAACSGSSCADCERDCALSCASTQPNPFPVEWLGLEGMVDKSQIVLSWTTASELNNDYFEIQRMDEADGFTAIGQLEGSGSTDQPTTYRFTTPSNGQVKSYFRIRQVDFDGQSSYSNLIEVNVGESALDWFASFIPEDEQVMVSVSGISERILGLRMISINGQEVHQQRWAVVGGTSSVRIPVSQLPAGYYFIQLEDKETGKIFAERVSISR